MSRVPFRSGIEIIELDQVNPNLGTIVGRIAPFECLMNGHVGFSMKFLHIRGSYWSDWTPYCKLGLLTITDRYSYNG